MDHRHGELLWNPIVLKDKVQRDHPGPGFTASSRAQCVLLLAVIQDKIIVPSWHNLWTRLKICRAAEMEWARHWECTYARRQDDALKKIKYFCKELSSPSSLSTFKLYRSSFQQAESSKMALKNFFFLLLIAIFRKQGNLEKKFHLLTWHPQII